MTTKTTSTVKTVKISTEPFTCPSCIKKIEGGVGRLDGVADVTVMFNTGKVKVSYDEARIAPDAIARTIEDLGYPVTKISA